MILVPSHIKKASVKTDKETRGGFGGPFAEELRREVVPYRLTGALGEQSVS